MSFTWPDLVCGYRSERRAWWWQDHKAQQEEISTMADQSSAELNGGGANRNVPLDTSAPAARPPIWRREQRANRPPAHRPPARRPRRQRIANAVVAPSRPMSIPRGRRRQLRLPPSLAVADHDQANVTTPAASARDGDELSADCWLEVSDATGKLFSGLQRKGGNLNLSGPERRIS